jgi:hypothetical protein
MARPKKTTNKLVLAIDFGTSGIKAAGSNGGDEVHTILLPPEIIEITESVARKHKYYPQDCINGLWIMMGDKYFALGSLAREMMATAIISQAKSRFACEKTAAIIWLMTKHFNLSGTIHVSMVCLLPPGELREGMLMESFAIESLKNFHAPDGSYSVIVERLRYLPEGIGVYEKFKAWYGAESLQNVNIGVVMMGHRNTSFFAVQNNRLGTFRSSELGFWRVTQGLGLPITGQLAEGASKWLSGKNEQMLDRILSSRGVVSQASNLASLKEYIDEAKALQIGAILQWLSEIINACPIDMVLIAGGAADSFKPELVEYFDNFLPNLPSGNNNEAGIFFHGGKSEGSKIVGDSHTRFTDISGVWEYLALS